MIEARYELFQPNTGILLGLVEMHKVSFSLGGKDVLEYLVRFEEREDPRSESMIGSERFMERKDAIRKFKELLQKYNSRLA